MHAFTQEILKKRNINCLNILITIFLFKYNVFMRYQVHVAKIDNPPLATCSY
jgi:hypothetical protein